MGKHPHAHNPPGRTPPALEGTGSKMMSAPSGQGRLIRVGELWRSTATNMAHQRDVRSGIKQPSATEWSISGATS